jgi:hypothetical protein
LPKMLIYISITERPSLHRPTFAKTLKKVLEQIFVLSCRNEILFLGMKLFC